MTGIVLAGGNNSRMGEPKAFLPVCGIRIIDRILTVYKRVFDEIIIVTNTPEDFASFGVKTVTDSIKGKGPLGGLYTGLTEARYERCFVTACDMPFLNEELIKYMLDISGFDIIVPMIGGKYEPLFSCYSKCCADYAFEQINSGDLKLSNIFSKANVRIISEEDVKRFDKDMGFTLNINTPEELYHLDRSFQSKDD